MRDPYKILFEPIKLGPVTAPNRFYQVPHCSGMGHVRPRAEAAMRGIKAEGGWGVISTQETEIHPSSDLSPYAEGRLWDARDIPALRLMTEAVHQHGSLAAIELAHNGNHASNKLTRAPSIAPSDISIDMIQPRQARAMDKSDIKEFRRWHRMAARRAKEAGFDIVYVYAGHHMTIPHHFLLPQMNDRSDEYGGSLENRTRLIRELLEETKEEVGDTCAVAFRFAVDELKGADGMQAHGEGRGVVELLAELPDLWDVNISDWSNDSATSRFEPNEGYQTKYIEFVKQVTSKPVVAVGRFTSPDHMVSLVKRGIVDFIGAARPSIADPFLPEKIKSGRIEDIRECIGCNICVSSDNLGVPIRCTQNPTQGEEWRRGWHPEKIAPAHALEPVLVIGGGPAGLECASQLAKRGYEVTLAEASDQLGGRVAGEASLSGLAAWKRVADHRIYDLQRRANAQIFLQSSLDADDVAELGIGHIFLATGAKWRRDGVGRSHRKAIPLDGSVQVFTPEDIISGVEVPTGPVFIFDDDQIYLGGVLAHHLAETGAHVVLATPASVVSPWCDNTLEQERIQASLLSMNVDLQVGKTLARVENGRAHLTCVYSGKGKTLEIGSVLMVSERRRETTLFEALKQRRESGDLDVKTLEIIGDAASPGLIADAVYSGHLAARNLGEDPKRAEQALFEREIISLEG